MKLPRVLDPIERISEILFGLIMVLTCTSTISVVTADRFQIRTMLIGALGCNLAWGVIDAGMYLMARLAERGRNAMLLQNVREAIDRKAARSAIAGSLPPLLASIFETSQLEFIRDRFCNIRDSEVRPRLTSRDWIGALGVCILVVLSTFPVVIPFILIDDAKLALRISNVLAIAMLFLCGFSLARHIGLWPWTTGIAMVAIGAAGVGIAITLGG